MGLAQGSGRNPAYVGFARIMGCGCTVAAAQDADVVFVSHDYDHYTVLAGAMSGPAPRLRVMSLDRFDRIC